MNKQLEETIFFARADVGIICDECELTEPPSVCPACGEKLYPAITERHAVMLDRKLYGKSKDAWTKCHVCGANLVVKRGDEIGDPMNESIPLRLVD